MAYLTDENIKTLDFDYIMTRSTLRDTCSIPVLLADKLTHQSAKKFCLYGVGRRVLNLRECLDKFYDVFLYECENRDKEVPREMRFNQTALLNFFFINIHGALDNIAWVINHENNLDLDLFQINLKGQIIKSHLGEKSLLKLEEYADWLKHIKSFRDPAAHRIPPYVIPYFKWDDGTTSYESYYAHDVEVHLPVPFHPQVLVDAKTICDIVKTVLEEVF